MTQDQKRGAVLFAVGAACIIIGSQLTGPSFALGETPWASLYDGQGHVVGGPTAIVEATEPETPSVTASSESAGTGRTPSLLEALAGRPAETAAPSVVGQEDRLLRTYPLQLFHSTSGPGRPFRWIDNRGGTIDIRVEVAPDQRLLLLMNDVQVLAHVCGAGTCTVVVNQREDGNLLVRFKDDDSALALLLNAQNEVQRWQGAGIPPMAPTADASIAMDPLPSVTCATPTECARLATLLWQARNHRYAAAYAIASGPAPSTLYTLASVYASAGDGARAAEYLGQMPERERRRAARDHDFDRVREDYGVQTAIDPSSAADDD